MSEDLGTEPDVSALEELSRDAGDAQLFPPEVHRLWESGKGRKARKALLRAAKSERDSQRARRQKMHAGNFRLWLEPLRKAPPMTTLNGVGTRLYGKYQAEGDGSYIVTLWFTVLFLPIWPLSSYLVSKAQSGGWHFFARSPRPPAAQMMQRLVIAAAAALAGLSALTVYNAETHTDVLVYNGYDQPVDVKVGETTQRLAPNQNWTFADVVAEPTSLAAGFADADAFESFDVDLTPHSSHLVIYNVGGRGLLSLDYVRYGKGQPKEGDWLEGGPVIFHKKSKIDYVFREPPREKKVSDGSYIENSVLSAVDQGEDPFELATALLGYGRVDQARLLGLAVLRSHPENANLALLVARGAMGDSEEQKSLFRDLIARAPDEVDLHRYYQGLWSPDDNQEVLEEYRAKLAADSDSAVNQYLLGRLLDDDTAEEHYRTAIRLDPSFDDPYRALGYRSAQRGDYADAASFYETFAGFGTDQVLEALDSRARLHRATGRPAAGLDALLAEASAASDRPFHIETQRLHLRLESDRSRLDTSIDEMEQLALAEFESEPGSPGLAANRAELAITAGDLDRARAEVATYAETGDRAYWAEFRLALSDGATPDDHQRLTADGPEWMDSLTESQMLAALRLLGPDERKSRTEALLDPGIADLARRLEDADGLRDVRRFIAAVDLLELSERCDAYLAAAVALRDRTDAASKRARAEYLRRARGLSVPGELPFVRS